jgi:hypothetical protein
MKSYWVRMATGTFVATANFVYVASPSINRAAHPFASKASSVIGRASSNDAQIVFASSFQNAYAVALLPSSDKRFSHSLDPIWTWG